MMVTNKKEQTVITKKFEVCIDVPDSMATGVNAEGVDLLTEVVKSIDNLCKNILNGAHYSVSDCSPIPSNGLTEYDGLKLGQTFKRRRSTFTIVGFNPHKPKNCVRIQNQNGKVYICSVGFCNMLISGTAPSNW
jgi:hypothetical protein